MKPYLLIAVSFVLVLAGFLLPFLMVLEFFEAGLVLSFSAYFSSLAGLVLALYGAFHYTSWRKRNDSDRLR
jgi:hypothetical protein